MNNEINKHVPIVKRDDEKRLLYGIVYEPDVEDSQHDISDAVEIEKACHKFMEEFASISLMHEEDINDKAKIVENYINPVTYEHNGHIIRKGSWVLVTHILDDELWKQVKDGTFTGYSLEGMAFCEDSNKTGGN